MAGPHFQRQQQRSSSSLRLLLLLLVVAAAPCVSFLLPSPPLHRGGRPLAAAADVHQIGEVLPERDPTLKVTRVSVEDAAAGICGYLVEAEVSGADVKKVVEVAKKGAALNAVYPGYRKGVIPPHAMQDIKVNGITAAIMDVCRTAMELHGLENFAVNERPLRMKVPKSYQDLAKAYKVGDDLRFACEIDATGVPGEPKPAKETEMAAAGAAAGAAAPAGK